MIGPTYLFDLDNRDKQSVVHYFQRRGEMRVPPMVQGDGIPGTFCIVRASNSADRPWDYIDTTGATLEVSVTLPGQSPDAGIWKITSGAVTTGTSALAFDITADALKTALNLNTDVISGTNPVATVTKNGAVYTITWTAVGARNLLAVNTEALIPTCESTVTRVETGDSDTREIQQIVLQHAPYAISQGADFTELRAPGAIISRVVIGTASVKDVQRIRLDPDPYGGTWSLGNTSAEGTKIFCRAGQYLDGKYFIIYDEDGSVAFWFDVSGTTTMPSGASEALRQVEVTTVDNNDTATEVATKLASAFNGDGSHWTATSTDRKVRVEADPSGDRPNASDGIYSGQRTGFTFLLFEEGESPSDAFADWNAEAQDIEDQLSNRHVVKTGDFTWDIRKTEVGVTEPLDVDTTNLMVQQGWQGVLSLDTPGMAYAFGKTDSRFINMTIQVRVTFPDQPPFTVLYDTQKVYRIATSFA